MEATFHLFHATVCRNLYTVYVNLPTKRTLAAHLRAKGAHTVRDQGADFPIGFMPHRVYPETLNRYDWSGRLLRESEFDAPPSALDVLRETMLATVRQTFASHAQVLFLFVESTDVARVLHFVHSLNETANVIMATSGFEVSRQILRKWPTGKVFAQRRHHFRNFKPGRAYSVTCTDTLQPITMHQFCNVCQKILV